MLQPISQEITLAGERLTISTLTDGQHIALDQWAQSQMIDNARRSAEGASSEEWDRIVGLALHESLSVTWSSSRIMRTGRGYARLIWESCRTSTAQLTEQRTRELVSAATFEEKRALNVAFRRVNRLPTGEVATSSTNPTTPALATDASKPAEQQPIETTPTQS
jgi:hypothetical protein